MGKNLLCLIQLELHYVQIKALFKERKKSRNSNYHRSDDVF